MYFMFTEGNLTFLAKRVNLIHVPFLTDLMHLVPLQYLQSVTFCICMDSKIKMLAWS